MVDNSLLNTFAVDIASSDGQRYVGTFTSKKLTIRDITQLGVRRTQLCGGLKYEPLAPGQGLDVETHNLNNMIAHLELALTVSPPWWDLEKLTDLEVLSQVYKEVLDFENNFPGTGRRGTSEAGGQEAQAGTDHSGLPEKVVVGEVSAALEP